MGTTPFDLIGWYRKYHRVWQRLSKLVAQELSFECGWQFFFGMAIMYAEGLLAIKYRTKDDHGAVAGGPMHYILLGMGEKWRPFNNLLGTLCLYRDFGMELLRGTLF